MEEENIVLAYIGLEKALRDIAIKLGMGLKIANQRSVIEELVKRNLIKREEARLFDSLRRDRRTGGRPAVRTSASYHHQYCNVCVSDPRHRAGGQRHSTDRPAIRDWALRSAR
jgi:hypothetical protein